jgi:hypothetical protein
MKILNIRRLAAAFAFAAVLGGLTARPVHAAPAQFVGLWLNTDSGTGGFVRLQITAGVHGLGVRAFGACSPSACDWGQRSARGGLTTYGNNVSDADHKYGTALYNHGFATRLITLQLIDSSTLVAHVYTTFHDGSGRQNYHSREVFKKLIIKPFPFPIAIGP